MGTKKNKNQSSDWQMYKRLLWDSRYLWKLLVITVIGSIIYSACDSYSIYLIKPIINKGIALQDTEYLEFVAFLILFLFLFRGLGAFLSSYYMGKLGTNIVMDFRIRLFDKFQKLPASYYDRQTSGALLSKMLYNVNMISNATGNALRTIAQDGSFAIGLLINMLIISWKLCFFLLIIAPFLGFFISWLSKRFRRLSKNTQNAMGELTHVAEESILNYKEVRIFGGQEYQAKKFKKAVDYTYVQMLKTMITQSMSSPVIQVMGALVLSSLIFTAAYAGVHSDNWLNPGDFVAFFMSMIAILKPIKNLTNVNSTIQKALAATEDLYETLDSENEKDEGKKVFKEVKGNIKFENVMFQYTEKEVILKNISFEVKEGESVAFVGPSGGGKSTIINLINRFYNPQEGKILIDNEDISNIVISNLRDNISMVSQHVSLFNDTIYHNIAYGKKGDVKKEDVINAAKLANAWDFIERMPDGLDTQVGENGLNLSGGQRQRIAIARALLKDSPILILDEATSALDNESEKKVKEALNVLMKNRTTIIIAHRLTTIENADKIVVLSYGEVAEEGSHKELLEKNGIYANLYRKSSES